MISIRARPDAEMAERREARGASLSPAFSRGGQTLFIDFNVHAGVPNYMRNVPAIGPGGEYIVQMPDGSVEMIGDAPRFANADDVEDKRNGAERQYKSVSYDYQRVIRRQEAPPLSLAAKERN